MNKSNQNIWRWGCLSVTLLVFTSCSRQNDALSFHGQVTLGGKPLTEGVLVLSSVKNGHASGPIAIQSGLFHCDASHGIVRDVYRVEIVSYQKTGRTSVDPDDPERGSVEEIANVVPQRYNLRSELTLDLTQPPTSELNFDLKSR